MGLSDPGTEGGQQGGVGLTLTWPVTVNNDIMTFTSWDSNDKPFTFTKNRVVDANNPIVGRWEVGATAGDIESLTFYPNGTYIHWGDGDSECPQKGVEYGTYTYNASTRILTATSMVDENGDCGGITNVAGLTNIMVELTVNGDVLTDVDDGGNTYTLNRVK